MTKKRKAKLRTWAGRGKGIKHSLYVTTYHREPRVGAFNRWKWSLVEDGCLEYVSYDLFYRLTGIRLKPGELVELPEREAQ